MIPHEQASSPATSASEAPLLEDTASEAGDLLASSPPPSSTVSRHESIEGQSRDDPIILEDSSPVKCSQEPKKTSKPLHPFFTPRATLFSKPAKGRDLLTATEVTENKKDVIIIESSPPPAQPVHPFFAKRPVKPRETPPLDTAKPSRKTELALAPFPSGGSQHVRGVYTQYVEPECPWKQKDNARATNDFLVDLTLPSPPPLSTFLSSNAQPEVASCPSPDPPTDQPNPGTIDGRIPFSHVSFHPVISRRLDSSTESDGAQSHHQLWSEKWRPRRADEVLGNEESALYLRDWLTQLQITLKRREAVSSSQTSSKGGRKVKPKRPKVVRVVEKAKKTRSGEDSWLIPTDEESEEEIYDFGDDEDFWENPSLQAPPNTDQPQIVASPGSSPVKLPRHRGKRSQRILSSSPAPAELSHRPNFPSAPVGIFTTNTFKTLTNTIVLVGPSGAGKTAAVYACADELGYEVFEVFPGIGRRNGSNLESLVGEVGKNHLVGKGGHSGGGQQEQPPLTAFRGGGIRSNNISEEQDITSAPTSPSKDSSSADFGFLSSSSDTVRQSLILLEEVDILFKEDTNFWPTVVKLIRDCKRPVICTCNGELTITHYPLLSFAPPLSETNPFL